MKFYFKTLTLLMLMNTAVARDVVLVGYQTTKEKEHAETVARMLSEGLGIPMEFVSVKRLKKPCEKDGQPIIQFCFDQDLNLQTVEMDEATVMGALMPFMNLDGLIK